MPEPPKPSRKIKVDLVDLAMAFEDASGLASYHLDLETGEVVRVSEDVQEELNAVYRDLEEAGEHAESVPGVKFHEALARRALPLWLSQATIEAYQVENNLDGRYVLVERAFSSEGYRDMEEFTQTVQDDQVRERLEDAIGGRGPFRRFKASLERYPRERERWFHFKDARLQERVLEWLRDIGIEPEGLRLHD